MKVSTGDTVNPTIGGTSWVERIVQSIPASYTVWYNSTDSKYYGESNLKGIPDISPSTDATTLFDNIIDSGRIIFVRDGNYIFSSALTKNVHECKLIGESRFRPYEGVTPVAGNGVVFTANATMTHILQIGDGTDEYRNNFVSDIKFDCASKADYGLITNGWNDGTIERCMGEYAVVTPFLFTGSGGFPTSNVEVHQCWGGYSYNGFQTNSSSEEITFYKCLSYVNNNAGYQLASTGAWDVIDSIAMADKTIGLYGNIYKTCNLENFRVLGGSKQTDNGLELYLQNDVKAQVNIFGGYIEDCLDLGIKYEPNGTTNELNIYGMRVTGCTNYALSRTLTNGRLNWFGGSVQGNGSPPFLGLQSVDKIINVMGYITENSGSSTGTGAQQTIAHGCNFTPSATEVYLSERTTGGALAYQSTAPDATNIYVTAAAAKDYNWKVEKA